MPRDDERHLPMAQPEQDGHCQKAAQGPAHQSSDVRERNDSVVTLVVRQQAEEHPADVAKASAPDAAEEKRQRQRNHQAGGSSRREHVLVQASQPPRKAIHIGTVAPKNGTSRTAPCGGTGQRQPLAAGQRGSASGAGDRPGSSS